MTVEDKQYSTPHFPKKKYSPKKRKSPLKGNIAILLIFILILAIMYYVFPKENGRHYTKTRYTGLMINEVMSANTSALPDQNGEFPDWIELYNGTGQDLNLEGVMITDRNDSIAFYFPYYILPAGGYVVVFASGYYQLDPNLPFHANYKISSAGEHIYLFDPDMFLIDDIVVPTLTSDKSYSLSAIDDDGTKHYETTEYFSPGYRNNYEGFTEFRNNSATKSGDLILNEVSPDPKIGIPDQDQEIVDWIELKNNTNEPISLENYYLSDNESKPMTWRFPKGSYIPANGYFLVYCSKKDLLQANGIPHTNFAISAERETIVLSDSLGRLIDRIYIENIPADYSVGRIETGEWRTFDLATPGQSNDIIGQNSADALFRAYNTTGVYITEVVASNDNFPFGASNLPADYLELYNTTTNVVDLSLYGLSDDIGRPRKWQFPQGTVIEPNSYLLITLDSQSELSTYSELHANFSLSREGGETVSLCTPEGRVIDRIPLKLLPADKSYGRSADLSEFSYFYTPTPAAINGDSFYGYVNPPSLSVKGGIYKNPVQISINIPEDTIVYYSTDSSIPTIENGIPYLEGDLLNLTHNTVLRVRAFDPNTLLEPSEVISQTYFFNLFHTVPVVSLIADPDELWNPEYGMLTVGDKVDKTVFPFENTVYREFGKTPSPGYVEIYDLTGSQLISQGVDFSLQGQYSLDLPQKSFKIRAKAEYGQKYFETALFDDRPFTQYKSFVLRMGGNDGAWTRLLDGLQGKLIDEFNLVAPVPSTVIHQAFKPAVVYLNGIYWGHYNIRERVDRYFVAQHEGLSLEEADAMDILEGNSAVNHGSNKEYKSFLKNVKNSSPGKNPEDLQYILDNIDVQNYFDYASFEIFFGNSDPGNIRYYKLHREGSKWKWIFYDSDYGLFDSSFNSPKSYLDPKGAGQQNIDYTLLLKLLENKDMKHQFLTRLGEIFQVFNTEFMSNALAELVLKIEPEMTLHFNRWAEFNDPAVMFENPTTPEGAYNYWLKRIDRLYNTLKKRPTYFYDMVQEQFKLSNDQMIIYFGEKPPMPEDAII